MTSDPVEGRGQMPLITQQFYRSFYSIDPVDDHQLKLHLNEIQGLLLLTATHNDILQTFITIVEIVHETVRVENKLSSLGEDDFGYAFFY